MADNALYSPNNEVLPIGVADAVLKRNAANNGWEYKTAVQLGVASKLLQTTFVEQTTDTSTGSAAFGPLLTQVITTSASSFLIIHATTSFSNATNNTNPDIQLVIDGSPVRGAGERIAAASALVSMSIVYRKSGLVAGAHTVLLRWRTSGGSLRCRPVATVNEHASLVIQEVTA